MRYAIKLWILFLPFLCFSEPRHIYLTWEDDTSTSITINIHHLTSDTLEIAYDTKSHSGEFFAYETPQVYYATPFMEDAQSRYLFHITLHDLKPDQTYYFMVKDPDGSFSKEMAFHTIPLDGSLYRFASGGDWEVTDTAYQVARQAAKTSPLAVFLGGDYPREVYTMEDYYRWDEWLDMYSETMITPEGHLIPMVLAIGNNDVFGGFKQSPSNAPFYYNYFKQNKKNKSYFSKQFGKDISLFILDSGHTSSYKGKQLRWLKKTLPQTSENAVKLAVYHVPIYPSIRFKYPSYVYKFISFILWLKGDGHIAHKLLSEGSVLGEKYWVPLFDAHGITAAFEHHDQTLKRTIPLKNGMAHPKGTVYLGDGGWGPDKQFTPIQTVLQPYFAKTIGHIPFFWLIDVEKEHIIYRAITAKGNVIDEYKQPRNVHVDSSFMRDRGSP